MMLEELEGRTRTRTRPQEAISEAVCLPLSLGRGGPDYDSFEGGKRNGISSLSDNVCKQSMHITNFLRNAFFYQRAALLAPLINGRHRHSRRRRRGDG